MILSKFKLNKHQEYIGQLPKLPISVSDITTLYSPTEFCEVLLKQISKAKKRICITALYLENDKGGCKIMQALYAALQKHPQLDISILVDWHRARRKLIGVDSGITNAIWYYQMALKIPQITIPIYGVPINTTEALGVLHLKGFIIDDTILYSGANLNNVYLHQKDKYRYDRYHLIRNLKLTNIMYQWICENIKQSGAVNRFDQSEYLCDIKSKNKIRKFRNDLREANYQLIGNTDNKTLSLTPLIGLGKHSLLNETILNLILCTKKKLIFCTPYFNPPKILIRNLIYLLGQGKKIEIIVGDKIANDFYITPDQPFKFISLLPYLYEIKLRHFLRRLQYYISNNQLTVRVWKNGDNSYHLKGIWVDEEWMIITGNNLNPRAWTLDLENAILIHDPLRELDEQRTKELQLIRKYTNIINHFYELERISNYPKKIRKLIRRLRRISLDRLINRLI